MTGIDIRYTKAAEEFFRVHENVRLQYKEALQKLLTGAHPEQVNVRRIQGKHGTYYRIRLGDRRVIYTIVNGKILVIETLPDGSGGDVYKKPNGPEWPALKAGGARHDTQGAIFDRAEPGRA